MNRAILLLPAILIASCEHHHQRGRIVKYCDSVHGPRQVTAYSENPEYLEKLNESESTPEPRERERVSHLRTARTLITASHGLRERIFPWNANVPKIQAGYLRSMSLLFEPGLCRRILLLAVKAEKNPEQFSDLQFDRLLLRKWGVDYEDVGEDWDKAGRHFISIRELLRDGKIFTGYVGFTELHFVERGGSFLIRDIVTKRSCNGEPLETWRLSESLPRRGPSK